MSRYAAIKGITKLRGSDLRGLSKLVHQLTLDITEVTEGVHQAVYTTLGMPHGTSSRKCCGLTGSIYRLIYGTTNVVGSGVDKLFAYNETRIKSIDSRDAYDPQRLATLSFLNGIIGDRFVADGNPLALPMTIFYGKQPLDATNVSAVDLPTNKVLLMVHGLCSSPLHWEGLAQQQSHSEALVSAHGYTPLHLHYNSGLHVSQNGQALAVQLEQVVHQWPVTIEDLTFIGHSMGGLVIRSALYYAEKLGLSWHKSVKHAFFLGTPHKGAPLERAGNTLAAMLERVPYTVAFSKLTRLRSAGVTDLRYGYIRDDDWQSSCRFTAPVERPQVIALPTYIRTYAVGSIIQKAHNYIADHLVGDGLVPLTSALGENTNSSRALRFTQTETFQNIHHMELLNHPLVTRQLLSWLDTSFA
ncbi:esterase/lipase family protein [Vibrio sp. PNB23_22_6]|jgi:pimeloyl-ACP methyl ester carboxylesterase|uniref:esterase/lipase family protein n=1 Tax=Vibrio TaxID=662 RepID=UPI000E689437|nr:alpha/beta hydrolase [Vibrio sp. PID23_8]RIZ55774.1 hypothetical protein AK966_04150 [Vibrio sp. PID23_8]